MGSEKSSEFSRQSLFFKSTACLEYYSLGSASDNDNNSVHGYLAACSAYYSALRAFQESVLIDQINDAAASPKSKRQKIINGARKDSASASASVKMSHITVERNRRKVMNERLSVLRSLMPRFYIKKSDKASIIGGVVNYIHELQQILRSLECKMKSKASIPKLPPPSLPMSPSTSRSSSPYNPRLQVFTSPIEFSPSDISSTSTSTNDTIVNELVMATSRSVVAEVEVKFSGPNLLLKTTSRRFPGQAVRIISALEELELEILDANITALDNETIMYSFTIKIGIECQVSAEELTRRIHRTFC
ncbi:transcription factor MUTE-like isoform X2 [Primulina huaijiensis]|uniref:transcription factor MUTE-like isoform X2 n=1 Tax=Primulina huaijiensis TaxID=1492673 RepID=UPI003CC74C45